ncbi:MAG TPA: TlpA disulfide reductase family protein [Mycobacteriales bacterium]|jgi:peroxiredoxin|nr:TlpA disulfide reductase family protein [Mycobacteriales bacterium]
MTITLIGVDGATRSVAGTTAVVDAMELSEVTGWALKPQGLCRGAVCVPLLDRKVDAGAGEIDLAEWAAALGYLIAVDVEHSVVALAPAAPCGASVEVGSLAPDVELPGIDGNSHSLAEFAGRKRVLVTWASWCGCRHELGAWRELQDELGPAGLSIFSVALDNSVEDARPWIEAGQPSYPVVIDSAHVTAERFGITNVPSTVWIDEGGRIVKPPTISPGDDQFRDFTKIDSAAHHEAMRRWVSEDVVPDPTAVAVTVRSEDEQLALAERRLGAWLQGQGYVDAAAEHLARAVELAPWDWTVRRASIALRGGDPFLGAEFIDFWQEWDAAGRPGYQAMRPGAEG